MKTRNKFESRTAKRLEVEGVDFEYEVERLPYVIKGFYKSDFTIRCKSGKKIVIETKGYFRPEDKRKMVAVRKQHPDLDIRILFYSLNKSYIKWAEKHGFRWAVRELPTSWIQEFTNGIA